MLSLPSYVRQAISTLEAAGFSAYCVGGCVRDSLLGKPPKDWDIATTALPAETLACFSGFHTVQYGKRHGTVPVILQGRPVEITTMRLDGDYADCRRPQSVTFTADIRADLSRRDFTMNAMAWNEKTGLVDPFGGQKDLQDRRIRCVGDPATRFSEDALRILRCVRFAAQLGFSPEIHTAQAARNLSPKLLQISAERVAAELSLLVCGAFAADALHNFASILFTRLPLLAPMANCAQENPYHVHNVWAHTLHALSASPPRLHVRLATLFHDCGKPTVKTIDSSGTAHFYGHAAESANLAAQTLLALRFPKITISAVCALVKQHDQILPLKRLKMKRLLAELGREGFFDLMDVMQADICAQAPFVQANRLALLGEARQQAQEMLDQGICLTLADLAINGKDLCALGFSSGKQLGDTLDALLQLVLREQLENNPEPLLRAARKRLEKIRRHGQ